MRLFRGGRKRVEIEPDEILIDTKNVASLDIERFEGRIERPLSRQTFLVVGGILACIAFGFVARAADLQLVSGKTYAAQALDNQLRERVVFADRGLITDRTGALLAWNEPTDNFVQRAYATSSGIAHVLGYARLPAKDSSGFYFREVTEGVAGAEKAFDTALAGRNGIELTETNARGEVVSHAQIRQPQQGSAVALSIDAHLSELLYNAIAQRAQESGFIAGAGVVMDVHTGELYALVSYPEYSPNVMMTGAAAKVEAELQDSRNLFLNRATAGVFAPGSIVKPFVVVAALTEGIIDEFKKILSTGSISIPNPYDPSRPSVFRDWRANGWTDAREAIAASSDIYFYAVGGGFEDQKGLGIYMIDEYFKRFGFGASTGLFGFSEAAGTIPTPEWKEATFDGDPWRLGDTYNTSIGQYGMQVTPLQAARAVAALANGGTLPVPTLLKDSYSRGQRVEADEHAMQVAREGMRKAVDGGTAAALAASYVEVAGKTGTAQVGSRNQFMNSWVVGFWPFDTPRYAFAVVLERAPAGTSTGSPAAMRVFLDRLHAEMSEYVE